MRGSRSVTQCLPSRKPRALRLEARCLILLDATSSDSFPPTRSPPLKDSMLSHRSITRWGPSVRCWQFWVLLAYVTISKVWFHSKMVGEVWMKEAGSPGVSWFSSVAVINHPDEKQLGGEGVCFSS